MGKKLTSWGKRIRDREKEKDRRSRAKAVEERREDARNKKNNELVSQVEIATGIYELFQELINCLKNTSYSVSSENLSLLEEYIVKKMNLPKFNGGCTITKLKAKITKNSYVLNPKIDELTELKDIKYEDYKKRYSNFFEKIFGAKNKHEKFKRSNYIELLELNKKEEKRKLDFNNTLPNYESQISSINESKSIFYKNYTKELNLEYLELVKKVEKFNKEIDDLSVPFNSLSDDLTNDDFKYLFLKTLPVKFSKIDLLAKKLISNVKEISSSYYNSPSNNIKCGAMFYNNRIDVFLNFNEDYFPLGEKQINLLKNSYSISPMTKKLRNEIEKTFYQSLLLSYADFTFKKSVNINEVGVSFGYDTYNKKTGNKIYKIEKSVLFDRETFLKINLNKIDPSESITLFKKFDDFNISEILWANKTREKKLTLSNQIFSLKKKELELNNIDTVKYINKENIIINHNNKELNTIYKKLVNISGLKFNAVDNTLKKAKKRGTPKRVIVKLTAVEKELAELRKEMKDL